MRRSFDADEINGILNHPGVFEYASTQGLERLDVSELVADKRNVLLMAEDGGILCLWQEPGIYEIHTNFLKPESAGLSHGSYVRKISLAAYRWMFTRTDAIYLLTRIPAHNQAAARMAPLVGWVKEFERKNAWATVEGDLVDIGFYALRYDDWVRKTPDLMRVGREFHEHLNREFARHGSAEKPHPDEDCHDLHVGVCVEMMLSGQIDKAIAFYDRWARFSGYGLIGLVARNPTVIDIGTSLLQVKDGAFKVIMVR